MKRQMFISAMVSVLLLASGLVMAQTRERQNRPQVPPMFEQIKIQAPEIQEAVVEFAKPVKLLGAILKGDYLFLHDEDRMARGEDCSWVYARSDRGKFDRLVLSFHCIPVIHNEPAQQFTVITSATDPAMGLSEVVEYRFAGSIEGHKVPQAAER